MALEDFSNIAIWLLITFLILNSVIIFISNSTPFNDPNTGLGIQGLSPSTTFSQSELDAAKAQFYDETCSEVSPLSLDFAPCFIAAITKPFTDLLSVTGSILTGLWTFATAWTFLLSAVFSPVPGGQFFAGLLIVFFGAIQAAAVYVIVMQIAGIVRGGS